MQPGSGKWFTFAILTIAILLGACRRDRDTEEQVKPELPSGKPESTADCEPLMERNKKELAALPAETVRHEFTAKMEEPLVEDGQRFQRLNPKATVWLDRQSHQVALVGAVCNTHGPMELFACEVRTKEYESVVAVDAEPYAVQAALLAVGADTGSPAVFQPEFKPPTGTEIEITVVWKDKDGKRQTAPAQQWIRRVGTSDTLDRPWVFAGSRFYSDEESGRQVFAANVTGDLISVANFTTSVLDIPTRSTSEDAKLEYEAFTDHIPPRGTPVTLLLRPKIGDLAAKPDGKTK